MKNFKMLVLVATFSFAVTGVCFALASGHSRHSCAPVPGKTRGTKPYNVGYDSQGAVVCTNGPSKGKDAR
jgi:hypothetical protein